MAAGVYNNGREILYLQNRLWGLLHDEMEQLIHEGDKELTREEKYVLRRFEQCIHGIGFEFSETFKTRHQALFLVTLIQKSLNIIQSSNYPFEIDIYEDFKKLIAEIIQYAERLPEKARDMQIKYKGEVLLDIACEVYEKFRITLVPFIKNAIYSFKAGKEDILYFLEPGKYGFTIGLSNFLFMPEDIVEFAECCKNTVDEIQQSSEPLDEATEKQFREFYQKLIALTLNNDAKD